jgi:hypothetical protein
MSYFSTFADGHQNRVSLAASPLPPGPILGLFRAPFRGSFWDHSGSILGPCWVHSGAILGPFWGHSGSILGPFWAHSGLILGPFWALFRVFVWVRQNMAIRACDFSI